MGKGTASSSLCKLFALLYFTFLLLINAACCISFEQRQLLCQDKERSALLQFKDSLTTNKSASSDPSAYPKVVSWGRLEEDPQASDCCSWDGVECNEESGHVIGLDLASSCLYGSINSSSSLFQLVQWQRLDLSDNNFSFSQLPSRLGHDLTSLTYLNLSMSSFSGHIPSEISYLSKLSTLDLSANPNDYWSLPKMSNFRSLVQNLTNLKTLHLSLVEISSAVPDTLVNLSSLTSLHLESCELEGQFRVGIFLLPNLQVLDLSFNYNLSGLFPDDLNKSSPLKILNLQSANFSGHLPSSIGQLPALNLLNIADCHFYPHVPSSLSNLTELNFLDLSSFFDYSYDPDLPSIQTFSSGQVSDSWSGVGKLTKLKKLSLADTNLRGDLPCSLANLTQLSELDLSYNQITGQFPSCLEQLTKLTVLNLGFNNLHGGFPMSLFQLQNLESMMLHFNNLTGYVQFDEFARLKKLTRLSLSYNKLHVQFKTRVSASPTKFELELLGLSSCNLTDFPVFLKDNTNLMMLDLSKNYLQGKIPKWMWMPSMQTLRFLNLSHNSLTGFDQNPVMLPWNQLSVLELGSNMLRGSLPIPSSFITTYSVHNNYYTGEIPAAFCNSSSLSVLDLTNNNLNGKIPQCFENLRTLNVFNLRNNSFQGKIPQILFDRTFRSVVIDLSYNQFRGKLPRSLAKCPRLVYVNVGNNQISDTFPSWLGALPKLRFLIPRFNGFYGKVGKPTSSHEFPNLSIIDLSNNAFSGMLPSKYLETGYFMKPVDGDEELYFQFLMLGPYHNFFLYDFSITIYSKGVELKYSKTPYLLRVIDLSSNRFEGAIPDIIGNLSGLHLLNLSNNTLTGPIPSSLENLAALESVDLSQNQLSGKIPSDLIQLTFLSYFNVSHNRLHGPIPQGRQFSTFQEDMYQGNSGLCGEPLAKKCGDSESRTTQTTFQQNDDSGFQIELDWFVVLPGVVAGLIVGVVGGNIWTDKKHECLLETFSKRRRLRNTRRRREFRT